MSSFKSFVKSAPPRLRQQAPCTLPDEKVVRILGTSYQEPEGPTQGTFDNAKFQQAVDRSLDNGRGSRQRDGAAQSYFPGQSIPENIRQWADYASRNSYHTPPRKRGT